MTTIVVGVTISFAKIPMERLLSSVKTQAAQLAQKQSCRGESVRKLRERDPEYGYGFEFGKNVPGEAPTSKHSVMIFQKNSGSRCMQLLFYFQKKSCGCVPGLGLQSKLPNHDIMVNLNFIVACQCCAEFCSKWLTATASMDNRLRMASLDS